MDVNLGLITTRYIRPGKNQLEIFSKYHAASSATDLYLLTGGHYYKTGSRDPDKRMLSAYWLANSDSDGDVLIMKNDTPNTFAAIRGDARIGIRPMFQADSELIERIQPEAPNQDGVFEVEFGNYPQFLENAYTSIELEDAYKKDGLCDTQKTYTFNQENISIRQKGITPFSPAVYHEYEYNNQKYIRFLSYGNNESRESVYGRSLERKIYWLKVSPVIWLLDPSTQILVSKRTLLAGMRFNRKYYRGDFLSTEIKAYLDQYMTKDLFTTEDVPKNRILSENDMLKNFVYRKKV